MEPLLGTLANLGIVRDFASHLQAECMAAIYSCEPDGLYDPKEWDMKPYIPN
jgi:hypothetical protein